MTARAGESGCRGIATDSPLASASNYNQQAEHFQNTEGLEYEAMRTVSGDTRLRQIGRADLALLKPKGLEECVAARHIAHTRTWAMKRWASAFMLHASRTVL